MTSHDELFDPLFQKMVEAYRSDPSIWHRLNRTLRDAIVAYARERSAYYRDRVAAGAPFEEIPILDKALVRMHGEALLASGVPTSRRVELRTSGSTGEPLAFFRDTTQGPAEHTSAQRFLRWMQGISQEATMVWLAGQPHGVPGPRETGVRAALDRLRRRGPDPRVHPVPVAGLTHDTVLPEVTRWQRFRTWFLYGHASALDWVAAEMEELNPSDRPRPAAAVTTSDVLTEQARQRIGSVFGCDVHSWYGSHEVSGYAAGTIPGTSRYAFNPFLSYVEVVDERGHPLPPGRVGRLVVTDLNNHVMPFIRYDTDDLAVLGEQGEAGGFTVVEEIHGRSSEALRFPSGRIISGVTLGAHLFQIHDFTREVRQWQCVQRAPRDVELRVVWATAPTVETRSRLAAAVVEICDAETSVHVTTVGSLARHPSGKAWVVRREF